jgi:hypothetical protein
VTDAPKRAIVLHAAEDHISGPSLGTDWKAASSFVNMRRLLLAAERIREEHIRRIAAKGWWIHPFEASIDIASARVSCVGYKNVAT